ncbi:MAG: ribosome assembly cofactor RimP [Chlorobi bacterium]|nr:ribosome assembly cofactor RimP [Chlorobiota bacterium]
MNEFEKKITEAIRKSVEKTPGLFILELDITPDNNVNVIIDGDKPVPLSECIRITREVEEEVDKDTHNYALTVGTFDISRWFSDKRQFPKNIGRKLKVQTEEGEEFEGTLTEVTDTGIVLETKTREPKPVGKGKHTVVKRHEIPFENLKRAKVIIGF